LGFGLAPYALGLRQKRIIKIVRKVGVAGSFLFELVKEIPERYGIESSVVL
jgi:hypothetical protein